MRKVIFFIPNDDSLFSLVGSAEIFVEARELGLEYRISYCSINPNLAGHTGLHLSELESYKDVKLKRGDYFYVCGRFKGSTYSKAELIQFFSWLREQHEKEVIICSTCTGAFVLAEAGLLNHRKCTTHWKYVEELQKSFPKAQVVSDQLYVRDNNIYSTAGSAAGIDLALSIVEENHGPLVAHQIARELVLYIRRDGSSSQKSIYLDYRNHIHPSIHHVQDYLVSNIDKKVVLDQLADLANMSVRNLTRTFRKSTGVSIKEYTNELRIDRASKLIYNKNLSLDHISKECGFEEATQFRRLWKNKFGTLPSVAKFQTTM